MSTRMLAGGTLAVAVVLGGWMALGRASSARALAQDPWQAINVRVQTQEGDGVRFYDDLVKGHVVLINFMFTTCTNECPRTTANLVKVQEVLGDRLGRDVRMISVTVDAATDTPLALKKYAARYGTNAGWYFVTGRQKDVDLIRQRLGVLDGTTSKAQHTGMLVYGNEESGQWAATPAMAQPNAIARSVMRLVRN
jgi:protein SCO1